LHESQGIEQPTRLDRNNLLRGTTGKLIVTRKVKCQNNSSLLPKSTSAPLIAVEACSRNLLGRSAAMLPRRAGIIALPGTLIVALFVW
jgi:hypothetical protein